MKIIKIVVAGGRDFNLKNYNEIMKPKLTKLLKDLEIKGYKIIIVSGKAPGADTYGEKFAKENNLEIAPFPANWNKYGRSAGPIRNEKMARFGDMAIVFWDRKSRGSKNMIDQANKYKKLVKIINY